MRLYDLKVKVINKSHKRFGEEGIIITYKFYIDNLALLVRFGVQMEILYYYDVEIDPEAIKAWEEFR